MVVKQKLRKQAQEILTACFQCEKDMLVAYLDPKTQEYQFTVTDEEGPYTCQACRSLLIENAPIELKSCQDNFC